MTDFWNLVSRIDPNNRDVCDAVDTELSEKLKSIDEVFTIFYYISHRFSKETFTKTASSINNIVSRYLDGEADSIQLYRLRTLLPYLTSDVREKIIVAWLNQSYATNVGYVIDLVPPDKRIAISFLEKCIGRYKVKKSYANVNAIQRVFGTLSNDLLKDACELISKSTPAIAACLLNRADVEEEYILTGLKSISKVKSRRSIKKTIKLDMLKSLGPRGRLDAIKHIIREAWGNSNLMMLDPVPTKDELGAFLFPCVLKYNAEVSSIIKDYEMMILVQSNNNSLQKNKQGGD